MQSDSNGTLGERLLRLYSEHREMLSDYPWEWEYYRWTEFVIDVMTVTVKIDPVLARTASQLLAALGLLTPSALKEDDQNNLARSVLNQAGLTDDQAAETIQLLSAISADVSRRWGQLQGFLREFGDQMAMALADVLNANGVKSPNDAHKIAVLWLQNVANLPVLHHDDAHVRAFCKREKVDTMELVAAADSIGLSMVVVDDLLAVHRAQTSRRSVARSRESKR